MYTGLPWTNSLTGAGADKAGVWKDGPGVGVLEKFIKNIKENIQMNPHLL